MYYEAYDTSDIRVPQEKRVVLLYVDVNVGDNCVEVTSKTPHDDTWSSNIDYVGY